MPLYEPIVPIRYAALLVDTVRDLKPSSLRPLLAASGLPRSVFDDASAVLSISQFDRLIDSAYALAGHDDLGFEYGLRLGVEHHALLSLALSRCQTGDELLSMMGRYWRMTTTCFVIQYRRDAAGGEVTFRPAAPMSSRTLHLMEEMFAISFQRDYMAMTGNRAGLRIQLSMPRPAYIERYRQLAPAQFSFASKGLPQVRCTVTPALLEAPLQHRPSLASAAAWQGTLNEDAPARTRQCAAFVQLILDESEGIAPDANTIAEWLNLSPRTLLRYLAAEGHTLRELGAATRHRRACHMLRQTTQPIGQIAARLGYGSVIAFSNAFKQRAGVGPRGYRNSQAG